MEKKLLINIPPVITLIVSLLLATSTGCYLYQNSRENSTKPETDCYEKPYILNTWMFPLGDLNEQKALFDTLVNEFEEKNKDIKVNIQLMPWADRERKLLTALAADNGPDVIYLNPDILMLYAYNNLLIPLNGFLSEDAFRDFNASAIKVSTYKGGIYSVPLLMSMSVQIYNLDMVREIGMDESCLPATYDELEEMYRRLKEKGKYGVYLCANASLNNNGFYNMLWSEGGRIVEDGRAAINGEAGLKTLERWARWYKQGYSPQVSIIASDDTNSYMPFFNSEVASITAASSILDDRSIKEAGFRWAIGPQLEGSAGAKAYGTVGSLAITKDTANAAKAFRWIDFLCSPQSMEAINKFSGYIPTRKSLPNIHGSTKGNDIVLSQLEYMYNEPSHPVERKIMPILQSEIQAAMLGKKTAAEALEYAAGQMENAIREAEESQYDYFKRK